MSKPTLDHVAVAVESISKLKKVYQDIGCQVGNEEDVLDQDVKTLFLETGECHIELLQPLSPDGPVGKYIQKKGQGLHHICLKVDDIAKTLKSLKSKGYQLIHETPVIGAGNCQVAFIHPKSTGGVLLELKQATPHP